MSELAILSPCRTWRYYLERVVGMSGITVAFFGINASTAEAWQDDQTSRKWTGFAKVMGARRYLAGNPFAYRTPRVEELATAEDPVGPENAQHLARIIGEADVLVPCWGRRSKVPPGLWCHVVDLRERLVRSGKPIKALGFTACGQPRHPLTLPYSTPLEDWRPE